MPDCTCKQLGRTVPGNQLITTHGPECPLREVELFGLLIELTSGIEQWASEEDGVHMAVWPHYRRAMLMIGCPVAATEA